MWERRRLDRAGGFLSSNTQGENGPRFPGSLFKKMLHRVSANRERDLLTSELRDGLCKSLGRWVRPTDHHHHAVLPEAETEDNDKKRKKKRIPWMTEIGSDIRVLQPCSFPRGRRRWEINTRLATPAQERQRICHRTGMPRFLVISGISVNQEEGWITKQSENQTGAKNTLFTYIHKDLSYWCWQF